MACASCAKKRAARQAAATKQKDTNLTRITVKGKDGKVLRLLK